MTVVCAVKIFAPSTTFNIVSSALCVIVLVISFY